MPVEQVLVLWDGAEPVPGELADLVAFVEPDLGATPVQQVETPGISYALACWHLLEDEHAGELSPGAWRRARLALVEGEGGRRLAAIARGPEADPRGPGPASVRHGWALEPMFRHLAWIELNGRPDLMTRPAWKRLCQPEVLDLVLDVDAYPTADGLINCRAVRSGELAILVSLFEVTEPDQIRAAMPVGYLQVLEHLVDSARIDLDETEVAHWILCRDPATEQTAVHLTYLPTRHGQALMPWDLLSEEERQGGEKLG